MSIEIFPDQLDLKPTASFPYASFPFESFNPVQSRILEFYSNPENCIVASSTGSGKTATSEIVMSHEIRVNSKKSIYVSPLLSLAQQKYDNWRDKNHHFADLKVSICTGDYRLTRDRVSEINDANVVIITAESLNSRARNSRSDTSQFLKDVGMAVIDECHLLGVPGRGSHLESAVIKLSQMNPNIRFVMLSATLPNISEVGEWISRITKRKTNIINSTFRPVKLSLHFPTYRSISQSYDDNEESKVTRAMQIIDSFPQDKFIVFVHSKRTGDMMIKRLNARNILCDFHNGDLGLAQRLKVESRFVSGDLKILVATSSLAWGVDLPARRVIVLGVHRGRQEVETYNITQMVGRAGRPKYDKEGDAYILVPDLQSLKQKERVLKPEHIKSQLSEIGELSFHLVSEIHHKDIATVSGIDQWYIRTFAFSQRGHVGIADCHDAVLRLKTAGCVKVNGNEIETTPVGAAASMFYFDPFDVSALSKNITSILKNNRTDTLDWAFGLACRPSCRLENPTVAESEEIEKWYNTPVVKKTHLNFVARNEVNGEVRMAFVLHRLMNGQAYFKCTSLNSLSLSVKKDFERTAEMLECLDSLGMKWNAGSFFKELRCRIQHGIEAKYAPLVRLPGIGKVKAVKLYEAGLTSLELISRNQSSIVKALGCKPEAASLLAAEASKILLCEG